LKGLRWEIERGSTARSTAKLWSMAESADEDSWKLKGRAPTRSDLVLELRGLLLLFADTNPGKRLVVCVDELDKLDSTEHLIDIVNELKDLFHIQGVHFVVSVSTDALESFARRGLPSRDAFDSAFDTVLLTERFTPAESVRVISARAVDFAQPVALFCHAWSGGLARDLLRTARAAVEFQRSRAHDVTISEIVTHIVLEDLTAATVATLYTAGPAAPDLDELCTLHELLVGASTDTCAMADLGSVATGVATMEFVELEHEILRARVELGLRLAAGYQRALPGEPEEQAHVVGTAMAALSAPRPLRDRALSAAFAAVDRVRPVPGQL
jgi:hypothetical protein